MQTTFTTSERLIEESCINCGVRFGLSESHQKRLRDNRNTFYCPNGHGMVYSGKSKDDLLREANDRIAKEREDASREQARLRDRIIDVTRQARAARGQVTKIKNRVGKGICPVCNRYFASLHNHMVGQHPDYTKHEPIEGK